MNRLVRNPLNPDWLLPAGWEHIFGTRLDYRLGDFVLHLWRVQLNRHAGLAPASPPHAHSVHQLLYYQQGSGRLLADGESHRVVKGSVFLIPSQCSHQFTDESSDPAVCLAVDFTIDHSAYAQIDLNGLPMESEMAVLLSLVHTKTARPFLLGAADQQLIDRSIAEIGFESDRREIGYASLIQAELLRFVALCLRATQRAHGFQRHFRHTAWRHRLIGERAAALIREHATRQPELTLGEAARLCATSPNHLNRIFKAQTGSTFHHALLCHRLQCARELLEKGRLNCTEAAFESGFNDSNYFSRAFKKEFGYPPSAIR